MYLIFKARCSVLPEWLVVSPAVAGVICLICLFCILENSAALILRFQIAFRFIRLLPAVFRLSCGDLSAEEWPETPGTARPDHPSDGKKAGKAQPREKCLGTQQPHN